MTKTKEAQSRTDQLYTNKISTLEDQLMKSQSLFVELDESTRIQIEKLRSDNAQTVKDMQRKFDIALKKKDD